MPARHPSLAAAIVALLLTGMWSVGQAAFVEPDEAGFERVLAKSNSVAPPPYRAFRRLEGGLTNSTDKRGWIEAWTEYHPGRGFSYEVVSEGGSEYVRNKTLRVMLASEQDLIARGKRLRASLDAKNYSFEDGGLTDTGFRRILMNPIKKSEGLVDGSVLIDPETGLVSRIQGRLEKSPSFWLRDVDVTWKFAHVGGHVVPVEMSSTGRVRMFGRSNFKMTYQYASIDGRPTAAGLSASLQNEQ